MSTLRTLYRSRVPTPIRRPINACRNYVGRLARWGAVLAQVRGASVRDEMKLIGSALAAPALAFKNLHIWQDPILLDDIEVRVPAFGRFQLRKRTDDLWHVVPSREPEITRVLHDRLRSGGVFVDAGANIGVYTILASRCVGPAGRVLAVEMIPHTAAALRRHIELNGCQNVTVVERALSDVEDAVVSASVPTGKFGQASIINGATASSTASDVHTTTLDRVCADVPKIDVMKMDLEGAELLALKGGGQTLRKTSRVVIEANSEGANSMLQVLKNSGFQLQPLSGKDWIAVRSICESS